MCTHGKDAVSTWCNGTGVGAWDLLMEAVNQLSEMF